MVKRLKVIINPISGSGKAVRFLKKLEQALSARSIDFETMLTEQAGDAYREAIVCRDKVYSAILCLSGDGTINEVINGLMAGKQDIPLGVIPFGSGNVIAKGLGLKRNIKQFIDLYHNNQITAVDLGRITNKESAGRYFISMAGAGYDAEVAHRYHISRAGKSRLQAHLFSYFPISIKTLWSYRMPRIAIKLDGKSITDDAGFIQIANTHSYGGPFIFVPEAVMNDGLLDVLWFQGRSRLNILLYFGMAFLGNGSLSPGSELLPGKNIELSSPDQVSVQIDGDYCGQLPARIEIAPKAIKVFAQI
ncbi:MAG: diacylglycerol kinase family protein [Planctomycetota bacterium]